MKIAQITSRLSAGGAENQILLLSCGLRDNDYEVVVAAVRSGGEMTEKFRTEGFRVTEFGQRGALDGTVFLKMRRWLKSEQPDLVHTHGFKADVYAGFAASSLGFPLVCTKHGLGEYLSSPFFSWLNRKACARCQRIVAVSDALRNHLVSQGGLPAERIEVIPVGIRLPKQATSASEADGKLRLGVVGRLVKSKGHRFLLQALSEARKQIAGLRLFVFGSGKQEPELRSLVNKLGLDDVVTFRGVVLEPSRIYGEIDLLVHPTLSEGAGLVLLEAMAHGIPFIVSRVGGVQEYVDSDCGILVPPADVSALTEAITVLAGNEELRRAMARNCSRRAVTFEFGRSLDSYLRLYEHVLRSSGKIS